MSINTKTTNKKKNRNCLDEVETCRKDMKNRINKEDMVIQDVTTKTKLSSSQQTLKAFCSMTTYQGNE